MTRSHEGARKKAQTQARSSHDVWGAGAEIVGTETRRTRCERRNGEAEQIGWQRQAHSQEVERRCGITQAASHEMRGRIRALAENMRGRSTSGHDIIKYATQMIVGSVRINSGAQAKKRVPRIHARGKTAGEEMLMAAATNSQTFRVHGTAGLCLLSLSVL